LTFDSIDGQFIKRSVISVQRFPISLDHSHIID